MSEVKSDRLNLPLQTSKLFAESTRRRRLQIMDRAGYAVVLALVLEAGARRISAACAWKKLQAISPE
jgi:hypothetical protein